MQRCGTQSGAVPEGRDRIQWLLPELDFCLVLGLCPVREDLIFGLVTDPPAVFCPVTLSCKDGQIMRAEELALGLRALAALAEDPGWVPGTHTHP